MRAYSRVGVVLCLVMMLVLMPVGVFCVSYSTNPSVEITGTTNMAAIKTLCLNINSEAARTIGDGIGAILSINDGSLSFNQSYYDKLTLDQKKEYMRIALTTVKSSGLPPVAKNKVYNFIVDQDSAVAATVKFLAEDTSADLATAMSWLRPFTGPVGIFLGVVSILVFLFLGVGMLMDCAYLALPGLQLILERGEEDKKPFGVSAEAWKANREVTMNPDDTRGVLTVYLKKRGPVILICAVCIGYLVSGKIFDILAYFADAFSRI